jgi:pseudouridine-5'-phosphate glycosidase
MYASYDKSNKNKFLTATICYDQGLNGGTTVSGTMLVAHKAGIPIFVTGEWL